MDTFQLVFSSAAYCRADGLDHFSAKGNVAGRVPDGRETLEKGQKQNQDCLVGSQNAQKKHYQDQCHIGQSRIASNGLHHELELSRRSDKKARAEERD